MLPGQLDGARGWNEARGPNAGLEWRGLDI